MSDSAVGPDPASDSPMHWIRGEYCEMPGLRLRLDQAQRLWSLDADTCRQLLDALVADGFLACSPDGLYGRPSELFPHVAMVKAAPVRRALAHDVA